VKRIEGGTGELVVSGSDSAVDFEMADHALDAVSLLIDAAAPADLGIAGDDGPSLHLPASCWTAVDRPGQRRPGRHGLVMAGPPAGKRRSGITQRAGSAPGRHRGLSGSDARFIGIDQLPDRPRGSAQAFGELLDAEEIGRRGCSALALAGAAGAVRSGRRRRRRGRPVRARRSCGSGRMSCGAGCRARDTGSAGGRLGLGRSATRRRHRDDLLGNRWS
jgi:hypothetical protein